MLRRRILRELTGEWTKYIVIEWGNTKIPGRWRWSNLYWILQGIIDRLFLQLFAILLLLKTVPLSSEILVNSLMLRSRVQTSWVKPNMKISVCLSLNLLIINEFQLELKVIKPKKFKLTLESNLNRSLNEFTRPYTISILYNPNFSFYVSI